MKKCPYCAEEIRDDALICRYCFRRVKGIVFRRIIVAAILLAVIIFMFANRRAVEYKLKYANYQLQLFTREIAGVWANFKKTLLELQDGLVALKNYNKRLEALERGDIEVLSKGATHVVSGGKK